MYITGVQSRGLLCYSFYSEELEIYDPKTWNFQWSILSLHMQLIPKHVSHEQSCQVYSL